MLTDSWFHRRCAWRIHDALTGITGHRLCCRIPARAARVGPRWDTADLVPWKLYNVAWRYWQWSSQHAPGAQD